MLVKLVLIETRGAIRGEKLTIGAKLFTELVTERILSCWGISFVANGPTDSLACAEEDDESLSSNLWSFSDVRCERRSARLLRGCEDVASLLSVFPWPSLCFTVCFTGEWEDVGSSLESAGNESAFKSKLLSGDLPWSAFASCLFDEALLLRIGLD